jgi:hypothetical protein
MLQLLLLLIAFRGNFASLRQANEQRHLPAQLEVLDDPV